jgi:hypothetical protein
MGHDAYAGEGSDAALASRRELKAACSYANHQLAGDEA